MANDKKQAGLSSGIRIVVALLVAISLALFILGWDGGLFQIPPMIPLWVGFVVLVPLLAAIESFIANLLIQYVSCKQVSPLTQFYRALIVPVPFILAWIVLYFIPGFRWPIEGLFQTNTPEVRKGLSSAFYVFWIGLYSQTFLNGIAQACIV